MPVRGVICPVTQKAVDTDVCLDCSLTKPELHKQCGCDTIILAEMLENRKVRGPSMSEVTTEFMRKTLLSRMIDYYVTPSNGYYAVRGKWIHEAKRKVHLDPSFGEVIREVRYTHDIFGLSGQVDCYYSKHHQLVDYKTSSRLPDGVRPAHTRQLNGYVELLRANNMVVDKAYITYLTYSNHLKVEVEVWERERTQEMLKDLVEFFDECIENHEVPPREECAGPDRWWICRYCPFNKLCKENPDWWTVDIDEWRGQ